MMPVNIAAQVLAVKRELYRDLGRHSLGALKWFVRSRAADPGQTGATLSLHDGPRHGSLHFACVLPDFGSLVFEVANC